MIRKTVFSLLAAMLILAVMPWLTGQMIEKRYHALPQQTTGQSGLTITRLDYQRGWLGAEAESRIDIPLKNGGTAAIMVHHHIRHGLLIFDSEGTHLGLGLIRHEIELPAKTGQQLQQTFGTRQPLKALTLLELDGGQQWQVHSEPLVSQHQNRRLQIHPFTLDMHINARRDEVQGQLQWAGLQTSGSDGKGEIAPLHWHFDAHRLRPLIWAGGFDWQQGVISFSNRQKYLVISGLRLSGRTTADEGERLSGEQHLGLDEFNINGRRFGPGKLDISIRHIPYHLIEQLATLQQQTAGMRSEAEAKLALQRMGLRMAGEIPALIASDPVLEVPQLTLQTPEGEIRGTFHFSIRGITPANAMNLPKIKQHARLKFDFTMPATLVASQHLERLPLFRQGILRREGDRLVSHARLENGRLVINERQIPLPF